MYKFVILACAIAAVSAEADPSVAYANGLAYGAAVPLSAPLAATYAAAPVVAAAPAAYAAAPVVAAAPAASAYALPPVRTIQEAPIVEQYVEPVEQWGYKVAY